MFCQCLIKLHQLSGINLFGRNTSSSYWRDHANKTRTSVYVKDLGFSTETLNEAEYQDILSQSIVRLKNIQTFSLQNIKNLSQECIAKILQALSQVSTLQSIPKDLIESSDFLESDANIDILCQCIRSQENLLELYMEGIELNDSSAFKIFEALSQ